MATHAHKCMADQWRFRLNCLGIFMQVARTRMAGSQTAARSQSIELRSLKFSMCQGERAVPFVETHISGIMLENNRSADHSGDHPRPCRPCFARLSSLAAYQLIHGRAWGPFQEASRKVCCFLGIKLQLSHSRCILKFHNWSGGSSRQAFTLGIMYATR